MAQGTLLNNDPLGRESKKERTYVYVWADSLHYAVEANITLQSKCTPIKIKF